QIRSTGMKSHYQIIVIGAGPAGMMVASQLLRKNKTLDIAIIDPSEQHYYQPAWTLVGAGTYNYARTAKPTKSLIPAGAEWIQDAVNGVWPEELKLSLRSGQILYYDYLVVAPGLVYDFSLIEG